MSVAGVRRSKKKKEKEKFKIQKNKLINRRYTKTYFDPNARYPTYAQYRLAYFIPQYLHCGKNHPGNNIDDLM